MSRPTVEEIVREWLSGKGYDGLATDGCGCEVDDLAPCGEIGGQCVAAYRHGDGLYAGPRCIGEGCATCALIAQGEEP